MNIGEIKVMPLAAESMGVRSLCTKITTPDITLILDPSAALAMRHRLEPHPVEYTTLLELLERIFVEARKADILSISHYHYDHVRPGFTNFRYNLSSQEELQRMFDGKLVFAKDNRENINASQRRRGFYFQKSIENIAEEIRWADGNTYTIGATTIQYSPPIPHGEHNSPMGYVIATTIIHDGRKVMFAPDVQGPIVQGTLNYIIDSQAELVIVGGPPIYLKKFGPKLQMNAQKSLVKLASMIPILVVDHHLLRTQDWINWLKPVLEEAGDSNNLVKTMAGLAGCPIRLLEATRQQLYSKFPPSEDFMNWISATNEYKEQNMPPLNR